MGLLGLVAAGGLGCGGDVDARMAEVRALQDVGQFTASIDELREILVISPDLPEATYRLGVALVQTGEPSRAVWALEKAAESPDYAIPASLLLASAHFSAANYEAVVLAANRVLEIDPERLQALRMRAQGYVGAGNLEKALEDTTRLVETYPDDYNVAVLHATVLADSGKLEEAEAAHQRIKELGENSGDPNIMGRGCLAPAMFARDQLKDIEMATTAYADCVAKHPSDTMVVNESVKFYDRIAQHARATQLIANAVAAAPENLALRAKLIDRLVAVGNPTLAEEKCLEAVESFRSAGAWSLCANLYRRQGDHEKALAALDKVLELGGSKRDQQLFAKADVLIHLDRSEEALEIAEGLDEPFATLLRCRTLLESGKPEEAMRACEQGVRDWPNNAGAREILGLAALELGDTQRAIAEFREAMRSDNCATEAGYRLARLHFDLRQYGQATRVARATLKCRGAYADDAYVIGIRSLRQRDKYDEAREMAEELRDRQGDQNVALVELASIEGQEKGPAACVSVIVDSKLDLTNPLHAAVLRAMVKCLLELERGDAALQYVDAAIERTPDDPALHELRGFVLASRPEEARAAYQRALELDTKRCAALAGLATLAANGGDTKQAVELFDKAAALCPDAPEHRYAAAQLSLASGDVAGAKRRLREVVRTAPGNAGARNDLAWLLAEEGEELDLAVKLAQEARRLDSSPEVLDTLGWVQLKRGETSAAVATLEEAIEARADSPSIRYRLGVALLQAGDADRARTMLQAAVDAGAFPEADAARRELAQLEQP